MSGEAALDRMIASARFAAKSFGSEGVKASRAQVESEIKATANAGTSPDGEAWAPRKDGGRAMAGAASHITVSVQGTSIVIALKGPDVFHHYGVRGEPRRNVIPVGTMPYKLGDAVRLGFVAVWKDRVAKG